MAFAVARPVPGFEDWFAGPIDPHPTGGFTLAYTRGTDRGEETRFVRIGASDYPHRLDGPATIYENHSGSRREEWWRIAPDARSATAYRVDGPSVVYTSAAGDVDESYVAKVGAITVRSRHRDTFFTDLRAMTDYDLLREAFEATRFGPLLGKGLSLDELLGLLGAGIRAPEGVSEVLDGAPVEWVFAFEASPDAKSGHSTV